MCLYDSDPSEPDPLYLRCGLCFQCQRNLNEQRRTEKKRPSKKGHDDTEPSILYALGPSSKKFKLDGSTIRLKNDAIIINGAVEGTRPYGEGYGFREIGSDLMALSQEVAQDTARLVNAVTGNSATASAAAVAALGAAAAAPSSDYAAMTAVNNALFLEQSGGGGGAPPPASEDINALYYKAFQSMYKSIFLLSQWKSSWDTTLLAATDTVADPSLNDAVASAAAVVAASMTNTINNTTPAPAMLLCDGQDPNPNSMVSLLLAADKSNDTDMATAVAQQVQEHVDWQMQQHARHGRDDDEDESDDGVGGYDDV